MKLTAWVIRWMPLILLLPAAMASGRASGQPFPVFDPERIFMTGDADLDGQLSLAEYREFLRSIPRMRTPLSGIDAMFERFDMDQDGFLSLAEYRKSFPARRPVTPRTPVNTAEPQPEADENQKELTPEQLTFFETKIRPVLEKHCSACHFPSAEPLKGGLRLDHRDGIRTGGDSGPALIPGMPEESRLIAAIRYQGDLKMPPAGPLPQTVIADFEMWVKLGAPDPRTEPGRAGNEPTRQAIAAEDFWAFRPPVKIPLPSVTAADWPRDEIDLFVRAKLESEGLTPVGDASRARLLRRLTFDLIGLPPTLEQLDAFQLDDSAESLEMLVDQLLASPQFGERWGRHWLDVARYAESSGKTNFSYPQAWRYRDWVIQAFNADKPYDQFVREQVAGDLLPASDPRTRAEQMIATGFLALGSKAHDAENRGQFVLDVIDEQIEATTRAFLGLTVACARCHDHKIDPISQRDYYALSGIFRSTQTCAGTLAGVFPNFNASPLIELSEAANQPSAIPAMTLEQRARLESRIAALVSERDAIPLDERNRDRLRRTNSQLAALRLRLLTDRPEKTPRTFAMGVKEREEATDSPLFIRGELEQPGAVVPRGLVHLPGAPTTNPIKVGSGRRELAEWLAAPSHPLTARVMVNRVWLHLFGRGIVATPDNFGAAGTPPSHPELLDYLAVEFMNDDWSIKRLIRRIVLSRSYGLDSSYRQASFAADPENRLIWRMSKRRLDAETVRDSILFVGGTLEQTPPVGSIVARMGEGLALFLRVENRDVVDRHRSIYLPVVRDQMIESLALFDFADPSLVTGERSITTGPAQALFFMNGALVIQQADAFADRVYANAGDDAERVTLAYRLALARIPSPSELNQALQFLRQTDPTEQKSATLQNTWSLFCQALLAGAEFRYID